MKTKLITVLTAVTLAAPLWAATEVDKNADGVLTIDEVQAAYPDITPETFSVLDVNADGALDSDEVQAAQAAGTMPAPG
jgi:hypothetical protein